MNSLAVESPLVFTDKILDCVSIGLQDTTRLLVFEGQVRSSKTETAKYLFYEKVQDSDEPMHLLVAQDLDGVKDKFLSGPTGLLEMFPHTLTLKKDRIGSYFVECLCDIPNKPKVKTILLAGYADASKWKKILGKTFGVILIDEVNASNETFVDETFMRQTSANEPLQIWTLNGDVPTHWVYQKYINRANIIGLVPASIRAEMNRETEKIPTWKYVHWRMSDNPIMTPFKIEQAQAIFKPGTYYHTVKVLGERGSPGKMIYVDYLDPTVIKPLQTTNYSTFVVGVDIGASRAQNSFSLTGFDRTFTKVGAIDLMMFQQVGYAEKKKMLEVFVRSWMGKVPIECISVDNAELNFIEDLKADFKRKGLPPVIACYKATIKQRIDLEVILFSANRIEFNDTVAGRKMYEAFQVAKWVDNKLGEEREDNNEWHNDVLDSVEYTLTRHMKKLLREGV